MQLKMFELEIIWSQNTSILELHSLILEHLRRHGEPLRWAIVEVTSPNRGDSVRTLKVESMVIIS